MKKQVLATLLFIAVLLTFSSSNINWWKHIIISDAKGYYAYLPAVFIYKDMNFSFFDEIEKNKYYEPNLYYDYRAGHNSKVINKYYCGTALAIMPFFLTSHFLAHVLEHDTDGYSKIYVKGVAVAAIFYAMLGLFYLAKVLFLYKITWKNISIVLITTVFGTNLFYYTVREPGLSHVYSFAFTAMFIYYMKRWLQQKSTTHLFLISLLMGMIVLIRPVNVLVLLSVPFLAGSLPVTRSAVKYIFRDTGTVVLALLPFLAVISIQFVIYRIQSGDFFIYSYGNEGFDFFNPHMIDILFSYKKGLFLYTPVYLVSFAGLFFFWRENRFQFFSFLFFFFFITYFFSSWWNWWYGGSFSSRVYVEFLPLFMISLAFALEKTGNRIRKAGFITLLALLILLCQVQIYQYRYYQIHWENMTKEKYWENFLRPDKIK